LEDIKAKYLQTVVSDEPGKTLMVVGGSHLGDMVSLIQRDKKRGTVRIQFEDGKEDTLDMDDVCEYIER
jgi:hypothetical protein